jgi:ATP-dependent Zn protease
VSAVEEMIAMGVDVAGATARVQAMTDEEWAAERAWICEFMRTGKVARDIDEMARASAASSRFINEIGDSPERVVVHEAGHAVVAYALGWLVEYVEPTTSDGGGVAKIWQDQAAHPTRLELWEQFREQVVVGVAGTVAEEIEFGLAVPFESMELADQARLQYGVPDDQIGALIEQSEDRARTILTANWPIVRHLADAQASRGRIDGDELAAIMAAVARDM